MKFTWLSNAPWTSTGYGDQTGVFLPILKEMGHQPTSIAYYGLQGGLLSWGGIDVLPVLLDQYGRDCFAAHTKQVGAAVAFSLMDVWVLGADLGKEMKKKGLKWLPWFPIDGEPVQRNILEVLHEAYLPIVMSKHGGRELEKAGYAPEQYHYIPHGIDTEILHPYDMTQVREEYSLPKDVFVIGMVAANKGYPMRKCFDVQLMAFAEFHKKHPDTAMYIHTDANAPGGVDLLEFCEFCGLELKKDIFFADSYGYRSNLYGKSSLAKLYSAMDALSLVSMGEGFGIPLIEAQACGVPVLTGDWSAMGELVGSGRKLDKSQAEKFYNAADAFWYKADVQAVYRMYETEYKAPSDREKARRFALKYDAHKVAEKYWKPLFDRLEADA